MEYAKQLILAVDGIAKACEEVRAVWEGVIAPEAARELDPDGAFAGLLQSIARQSESARTAWTQACGLALDAPAAAEPLNLREYHIQEFFENLVYDENGVIVDQNAYYCDQYKMNKLLGKVFGQSELASVEHAQEAIAAFQNGSACWQEALTALALELVQPILNDVSSLSPMLKDLVTWHDALARKNFDAFISA